MEEGRVIEHFREYLKTNKPGVFFTTGLTVDGVKGTLSLSKEPSGLCSISFGYNTLCLHQCDALETTYASANSFLKGVGNLSNSKFFFGRKEECLMSPEKDQEYKLCRSACFKLWNKEADICYVCQEDAQDHTTRCGHSICVPCYQKSIRYTLEANEFTCGVCRAEFRCEIDDCKC